MESAPVSQGYVTSPAPMAATPTESYPITPMESYPATSQQSVMSASDDIYLPPPAPPVAEPVMMEPTPMDSAPLQTAPTETSPSILSPSIDADALETAPTKGIDPFIDDPQPLSRNQQARPRTVAGGYRVYKSGNPFRRPAVASRSQVQQSAVRQTQAYQVARPNAAQPAAQANKLAQLRRGSTGHAASSIATQAQGKAVQATAAKRATDFRYLQARGHQATMRR